MDAVTEYLLSGDPAIRWQVMRDLVGAPDDEVAAERARVATEGWGARLLAEQGDDGRWDGGTYRPGWASEQRPFFDAWTATHFSLQSLCDYGLDPASPQAQLAITRVRDNVRWEYDGSPYFSGEVEPCINGATLAIGAYFGQPTDAVVGKLLERHLPDGGWNCWAEDSTAVSSFHSTICVLEGLRALDAAGGATDATRAAQAAGEEYLLARGLLRRLATGEIVDPRFTMLSYPVRWYYDVLRGLDHFRLADRRDPRLSEAVELVRAKAGPNGLFPYENCHQGPSLIEMEAEAEGFPSRWVTLRALRVLRWWDTA